MIDVLNRSYVERSAGVRTKATHVLLSGRQGKAVNYETDESYENGCRPFGVMMWVHLYSKLHYVNL